MIALNILLGVVAAVLLLGVLGEKDNQRHKSIVLAFTAVIALIICMNTIFKEDAKWDINRKSSPEK